VESLDDLRHAREHLRLASPEQVQEVTGKAAQGHVENLLAIIVEMLLPGRAEEGQASRSMGITCCLVIMRLMANAAPHLPPPGGR
jgi:hypothetical protein